MSSDRPTFEAIPRQARDDKTRRELIALVGSAMVARPTAAVAQPTSGMRRVGVLDTQITDTSGRESAFRQGLATLGWTERHNLALDIRNAGEQPQRLAAMAAELVALRPDVLAAMGSPSVVALRHAAGPVPIVFTSVGDPVAQGFVQSLSRPGGTITGIADYDYPMAGKWLELLRDVTPHIKTVAVIYSPVVPSWHGSFSTISVAAKAAKVDAVAVPVKEPSDIARVAAVGTSNSTGVIALAGALATSEFVDAATRLRLPIVSGTRPVQTSGILMSYSVDPRVDARKAASYVDRILRGAKPADLPVQNPTAFVLSINLKTAKQLGLTVPQSLLISANELIR